MDHFRFSPDSFLVHFISPITSRSTFPNTTFFRIRPCSRTYSDFLLTLNQIKLLLGFQDSSHLALPYLPNPVFHSSPPYTCHSVSLKSSMSTLQPPWAAAHTAPPIPHPHTPFKGDPGFHSSALLSTFYLVAPQCLAINSSLSSDCQTSFKSSSRAETT